MFSSKRARKFRPRVQTIRQIKMRSLSNIYATIVDLLVGGSLKQGGSWGGPICRSNLLFETHIYEAIGWLTVLFSLYYILTLASVTKDITVYCKEHLDKIKRSKLDFVISHLLGFLHCIMYAMLIYYKTNISSLITLTQPCHVVLLLEGIALLTRGSLSIKISLFLLPVLVGCLLG